MTFKSIFNCFCLLTSRGRWFEANIRRHVTKRRFYRRAVTAYPLECRAQSCALVTPWPVFIVSSLLAKTMGVFPFI